MAEVFDLSEGVDGAAIAAATGALAAGLLVVVPTDTVYGLVARPDVAGASARIFAAKRRPQELTLPVLVDDLGAAELAGAMDERSRALARRFWPGGVTVVVPRTERSLRWDLGAERATIALRVPDDPVARALLEVTGPLAVTSANVSGEPTPPTCEGVSGSFGDEVAVYLCADGAPHGIASTVVDVSGDEPRILREGSVAADDILAALG